MHCESESERHNPYGPWFILNAMFGQHDEGRASDTLLGADDGIACLTELIKIPEAFANLSQPPNVHPSSEFQVTTSTWRMAELADRLHSFHQTYSEVKLLLWHWRHRQAEYIDSHVIPRPANAPISTLVTEIIHATTLHTLC